MPKTSSGRKRGGKNRGYFYRKGRGWHVVDSGQMIALLDSQGNKLKDPKLPDRVVREAHARWLLGKDTQRQAEEIETIEETNVTVLQVCQAYLANAKATGAAKTHHDRADTLFDFCFGLPPQFRRKDGKEAEPLTTARKREMADHRIHEGYGRLVVSDLLPLHIDQWLNAHPTWKGGRRTRIQAVKRALNYAKDAGLIAKNPIRGYRTPRPVSRVTYITPEQEKACYEHARRALAMAIRVCIRTGARPGSEFAALTAKHVKIEDGRMEWKFAAEEIKTRRPRVIRIRDPHIIQIVKEAVKRHPTGPLFRNAAGKPWRRESLSLGFRLLKRRLRKHGIEMDDDACMYSCRHTYAKRILQGYWNQKPTNIETLARLMGNSPQVCREHYLQWSEIDNDPLWDAC
jgi:hypothetical protein